MVFGVYIVFEESSYQYLGRLTSGLNPNSAVFSVLPPHFICGMENSLINEATNPSFKVIIYGYDLFQPKTSTFSTRALI